MPRITLAANRTLSPQRDLDSFLALVTGAGIGAVEIRNDIPGREFADGTAAGDLAARLADAGVRVASINALQRFNDWTPDRASETEALCAYAAALGAPGIVMCPVIDANHGWSDAELAQKLRESLRKLAPIFGDHGITGLVEPLGMPESTLRRQDVAVAAIDDIDGWNSYALCYDTFQYFRAGDDGFFPGRVALMHASGITRTDLAPSALLEPDRGLVDARDIAGNIAQIRRMIDAGYAGDVSLEPFDPLVQTAPDLDARLAASVGYMKAELGL